MTDFAVLEQRINAASLKHCGEDALLDGKPVRGFFTANPSVTLGMLTTDPIFEMDERDLPLSPRNKPLVVNGLNFTVSVVLKSDATGFKILQLDAA